MNGTLNKVMLIGHLGDDVKIHFFDGGGCVGRFPIATNEVYTNKTSGEKVTNTDWHNVVLRNKAAEICEKYLSKGDKIYIEGRLKTRKWQDQDNKDRYTTEINVDEFTFLSTKKNQLDGVQPTNINPPAGEVNPAEDDLPF
jgi:single stranded DNA-binding protein (ssb)|tara:strand:+ start:80 stop:502 length:423 start_codon:yes stop_codon:yes gene_type:complete